MLGNATNLLLIPKRVQTNRVGLMDTRPDSQAGETLDSYDTRKVAYRWLRRSIGELGICLPLVVAGVSWFGTPGSSLQPTISDYYNTDVRYLFVGILLALAVLLFAYPGYDEDDDLAGNIAGTLAMCVLLFPTRADGDDTWRAQLLSIIHLASAAALFATLALFCFVLFRRTEADRKTHRPRGVLRRVRALFELKPPPKLSKHKQRCHKIYLVCGWVITISIVLLVAYKALAANVGWLEPLQPAFWLECLALWAFGLAWMVKGDAILTPDPASNSD